MSCSNCYNGCSQIVSDQCVKYTGIDIPTLGIKNGDTLSYVEQQITTFLVSTLDGSGIKISVEQSIICQIVKKYLPTCGDLTVVDFIKALIKAVCELKPIVDGNTTEINNINTFIDELEAEYVVDCLNDVTSTSGTHDVLQAVIDRLCAFIIDVNVSYVKIADLDDLIDDYLNTLPSATKYYTRMVPFAAVPFFPTPSIMTNFSGSGVGSGQWEKIYLCNGLNGTPDMRGRVPVGATSGMGGSALIPVVDPSASPFNPNYLLSTPAGANYITLTTGQMPTHTHVAVSNVVEPNSGQGHRHNFDATNNLDGGPRPNGFVNSNTGGVSTYQTAYATTGITVNTTNDLTGGNEAHSNVQPGIGVYYIMYIP